MNICPKSWSKNCTNLIPYINQIFFILILLLLSCYSSKNISIITLPLPNHNVDNIGDSNPDILYLKALTLYAEEKYMDALVPLGQILADFPEYKKNDGVQYFIGAAMEHMDMREMAVKNYSRLKEKYPKSLVVPFADLGIMRIAYRNDNKPVIIQQCKTLSDSGANDSLRFHAVYLAAQSHINSGKFCKAINLLKLIPSTHPEYLFAQHSLAVALLNVNEDNERAFDALINCVSFNPRTESEGEIINRSFVFLGYLFFRGSVDQSRSLNKAIRSFRKVPPSSHYYQDALLGSVWTAFCASQWSDCINYCDQLMCVTNIPTLKCEAGLLKGYCLMTDKRYVEAVNILAPMLNRIHKDDQHRDRYNVKLNKFKTDLKSYNLLSKSIDSLIDIDPASLAFKKNKDLYHRQEIFQGKLGMFYRAQDEYRRYSFFTRNRKKVQHDLDYALVKSEKMAGAKSGSKVLKKAIQETSEIDDEMVKLQRELEKLEEMEQTATRPKRTEEKSLSEYKKETAKVTAAKRLKRIPQIELVKAGSHDDNEEFTYYQKYCTENHFMELNSTWNINERYVIKVIDINNKTVPFADVAIKDENNKPVFSAQTLASGETILFPFMDLPDCYCDISSYSVCVDGNTNYPIPQSSESMILIKLDTLRNFPAKVPIQVCFLLDATGSMDDEISALKDVVFSTHNRLITHPSRPEVSFATVAYRDREDNFLTKAYNFTKSIDTFQIELESIKAGGGGDYPEDLDEGLRYAIEELSWNENTLKFIFLIGDAPPHLNYYSEKDYMWSMRKAREQGIMICPIGASGLQPIGEFIYRQIGVTTNGQFIFLHYGESGESKGSGTISDPGKVSHHTGSNYNVKRLDDIIVNIIATELGYVTDEEKIVYTVPEPKTESDFLDTRLVNLLGQIFARSNNDSLLNKKVVVSPFSYKDTILTSLSEYLWETTIENVSLLSPMKVIERQRVEEICKEHALDMTGITETNGKSKIGKLLSSDYIIFSSLRFLGSIRVCHMRLVDCKDGSMLSAARIKL